ncbi:hypothetical protein [Trichloromonas sp.]|uniref:hypothetical protein n=1 Tax=Trichloromonas sp. TaxID=3069249 RepID=UPI003D818BF8
MNRYYSRLKQFVIFKGSDGDMSRDYQTDKWYFEPKDVKGSPEIFSEGYQSRESALHAADDWEIEFA